MTETATIIAAASHRVARPIAKLGELSLVQRLIRSYQRAGVDRLVVVTGFEDPEIKARLMDEGVEFVNLDDALDPELIQSYRIGLDYLGGSARRVFLTPVNVPMYLPSTIRTLLEAPGPIVIPSYGGRAGHPVLVDAEVAGDIVAYRGPDGLAGFLHRTALPRHWVEVDDEGTLASVRDPATLQRLLPAHDESLIQPWYSLGIRKAGVVFDARTLLLLRLLDEAQSVAGACKRMSLSLTRAWRMINDLERDLGFHVVDRAHGGAHGGRTQLSADGRLLMLAYQRYRDRVDAAVSDGFDEFWAEVAPLRDSPDDEPT